ncbi:tRNA (guanine(26)-N(2))-dimethyltransferase, mitochondrial [Diutina catenulata]
MEGFTTIKEGRAEILVPSDGNKVFYNKIQCFNRDLSVMSVQAWHEMRKSETAGASKRRRVAAEIKILEALSATGLRANRYGLEVPHVEKVVANDMLPEAVQAIQRNIDHNGMAEKVRTNLGDAARYMGGTPERFHVVDLDPYGSAAPFLNGAVSCIEDHGLLMVTCTDAGVFAGSGYPEKCFSLYGGNNFGSSHGVSDANHEVGLRLILHSVAQTAARYGKSIEPLLSLSIDYYARLFIRIRERPIDVKRLAQQTEVVYGCPGCGHKVEQPFGVQVGPHKCGYPKIAEELPGVHCKYCRGRYVVAGPMWGGELHSSSFIDQVLAINDVSDPEIYTTKDRIRGMLTLARNELSAPFYVNLNTLSSLVKAQPFPVDYFGRALGNMGHKISLTHAKPNCIKTDAPWVHILAATRQWLVKSNENYAKEHAESTKESIQAKVAAIKADPTRSPNLHETSPGYKVLEYLASASDLPTVDFESDNEQYQHLHKMRKVKMVRFQENPEKNWGPMAIPKDEKAAKSEK